MLSTALRFGPWILLGLLVVGLYARERHWHEVAQGLELRAAQQVAADAKALTDFQRKTADELVQREKISGEAYAGKDQVIADIAGERDATALELVRVRLAARQAGAGSKLPAVPDAACAASVALTDSGDICPRDTRLLGLATLAEEVRDSAERCQRWVREQAAVVRP